MPLLDETGQPIIQRDATGQPIVPRDETGQELPTEEGFGVPAAQRADSILRPENRAGGLDLEQAAERAHGLGGTNYHARVALVQGYNSNVVQTQDTLNGPVTQRPQLFTGLDASLDLLTWTSPTDLQDFHIGARAQHYESLGGYSVDDDGTILGSYVRTFTLSLRTALTAQAGGTITSSNSALLSDGPLFQVDPSNLTRIYTLESARLTLLHELSDRWRMLVGVETWMSTTVKQAPILLAGTQVIDHHGVDYIAPAADLTFNHDLDPYNLGAVYLRYQETYVPFYVDYTKIPPQYGGSTSTQIGSGELRWTHAFSESLSSFVSLGAAVSQAPPASTDPRPILSPLVDGRLTYARQYWIAFVEASYSYGSANPRLGSGPSAGSSLTLQGVPYAHGDWNRVSVLANASASRSVFLVAANQFTRLTYLGANAQVRYGLNNWIGVVAGYSAHYSEFEGSGAYPPLLRHVFFLGVSGYFDDDKSLPTLDSFAGAVAPPG